MTTGTGSTGAETTVALTTGSETSMLDADTSGTSTGTFIDDPTWVGGCPDVGSGRSGNLHLSFECSIDAQDCCPGDKCIGWANDGGVVWNATRCSPLDAAPGMPGQPCTVIGNAVTGLDTCDISSMCWNVNPITLAGTCAAFCTDAGEAQYVCDSPGTRCVVANDESIMLCLTECNPLAPTCTAGELCLPEPSGQGWACIPTITAPSAAGEPCEYLNACAQGSVCVDPEVAASPACTSAVGCCTPLCDPTGEPCADPRAQCEAWYEPGTAPAGLEDVGICSVVTEAPAGGWLGGLGHYTSDGEL